VPHTVCVGELVQRLAAEGVGRVAQARHAARHARECRYHLCARTAVCIEPDGSATVRGEGTATVVEPPAMRFALH
jgi:hypothetical protein